ncbi:hypothetical protein CDAR_613001 [Caerostris darwini]|uniref:Uncharacterized protein n=1 Tax=Caerostris darwini TaxID=1538125 RepID=A0AAV4R0K7_9ARAC|nr:hypothetical protein CDAR_613001 [Caerostris darwini]
MSSETEIIESWLDEHPLFVHDYFVRKASRQIVDSWMLSHSTPQDMVQASSRLINTSSGAATPFRKT